MNSTSPVGSRPASRLAQDARHVLVVANPKAGARSRSLLVSALIQQLDQAGFAVERISDLDSLAGAVGSLGENRVRAVVAAGGDGTVSAVVNRVTANVPIAILPLGTENLLAKYLKIPANPEWVCQQIRQGWTVRVDAGQAGDRLFLLMVGIGFDAEVVRRLHERRRGHIRHFSYFKPIFDSIRSYQYPPFKLYCSVLGSGNVEPHVQSARLPSSIMARWAFVVNLPRYAAGLQFVPEALGTDGRLDVCVFERGSLLRGLQYLSSLLRGRHRSLPDVRIWQSTALRIESDEPVPYQLDGDPGGMLPLEIRVVPERVRLIVAKSWVEQDAFGLKSPGSDPK